MKEHKSTIPILKLCRCRKCKKDVLGLIDEMPVTGYIRDVEPAIVLTDIMQSKLKINKGKINR